MPFDGEITAAESRASGKPLQDPFVQAPRAQQRCLDDDRLEGSGCRCVRIDEDGRTVRPHPSPAIGRFDCYAAAGDRRCKQLEPAHVARLTSSRADRHAAQSWEDAPRSTVSRAKAWAPWIPAVATGEPAPHMASRRQRALMSTGPPSNSISLVLAPAAIRALT